MSDSAGARTQDLHIKSVELYLLSYGVNVGDDNGTRTRDRDLGQVVISSIWYVGEVGFEPTQPHGNRFTVCHDSPTSPLSRAVFSFDAAKEICLTAVFFRS